MYIYIIPPHLTYFPHIFPYKVTKHSLGHPSDHRPLFRKLGELGLLGVTVPEANGSHVIYTCAICRLYR